MWSLRNKDITSTVIFTLVGIVMFFESFKIQGIVKMDTNVGPGFFPMVVSACMLLLCAIKYYQIFTNKDEDYAKRPDAKEKVSLAENKVLFVFLAIIVYTLIFEGLGFFFASIIFLYFLFWLLTDKEKRTKRKYVIFGIIAILSSGIIYVMFVYGFQLMLPAGILSVF